MYAMHSLYLLRYLYDSLNIYMLVQTYVIYAKCTCMSRYVPCMPIIFKYSLAFPIYTFSFGLVVLFKICVTGY